MCDAEGTQKWLGMVDDMITMIPEWDNLGFKIYSF